MFNLIINECPGKLKISGHLIDINTNAKDIIKCLHILEHEKDEKISALKALNVFYYGNTPNNISLAVEAFQEFVSYEPNKYIEESDEEIEESEDYQEPTFDLLYDSNYIYCAFLQNYKIDLNVDYVHWWKFKVLLAGLPNNTKLSDIIDIRNRELPKDPRYKVELLRMKEAFKLPHKDKYDNEHAENTIDALFSWAVSNG